MDDATDGEESGPRAPAALRESFARLIRAKDLQPTALGRKLGYRGKDPGAMVRRFIEKGDKDLTLGRTAELARLCGATLRVIPNRADPWVAAIDAIGQLTEMHPDRRDDLVVLIERERDRRR